jgi:hypothetical protein
VPTNSTFPIAFQPLSTHFNIGRHSLIVFCTVQAISAYSPIKEVLAHKSMNVSMSTFVVSR